MADDERRDEQRETGDGDGDKRPDEEREENVDLRDPWDGPASENAYPEGFGPEVDGKRGSLNSYSRTYNRLYGETDEAANKPWQGPEADGDDAPSEEADSEQ